jgi:hypothetical protein
MPAYSATCAVAPLLSSDGKLIPQKPFEISPGSMNSIP